MTENIIYRELTQPGAKRPASVTSERISGRVIYHIDQNHPRFGEGLTWVFQKNVARARREHGLEGL